MLEKTSVEIVSDIGFRNMAFQKMEKVSIFTIGPVSQMSITFFPLEVESSMVALFKAPIGLYINYYR